jgi:hypothetical protein
LSITQIWGKKTIYGWALAMPCNRSNRIQNSGDRIQNKVFAFGSTGKYKWIGENRHCFILTSDSWLLNSAFRRQLSIKALSRGKTEPRPMSQDYLLKKIPTNRLSLKVGKKTFLSVIYKKAQ